MMELTWTRAVCAAAAMVAAAMLGASAHAATIARASDWLGSVVVTHGGDEVGTIRDLGIDDATGHVEYIVVSVGSFLIENNLIAVRPDALTADGDHRFVLEADLDQLKRATRFASDKAWPAHADVVRSAKAAAASAARSERPAETAPASPAADELSSGTATISSRTKLAYLSADERYVKEVEKPAQTPAPAGKTGMPPIIESKSSPPAGDAAAQAARAAADARFDQLDRDHDGVLNRAEIATEMGPKDKFSKLDVNADGVIERDEFEAFIQSRATP